MKYNYNKDFRKIAFKLPFSKLICFLSQTSLIIIIKFIKPPKNLTVRNFYINGFENQKILVKEILPQLPNDFALLVLHGGGFGYKTAPHQLTNAFEYSTKLNCKSYLVDYHLLPSFDYPVTDNSMTTTSMKTFIDTPLWNTRNNQRMWKIYLKNATAQQEQIAVPMKNHLPEVLPPTYLEIAEFDCLHDEGIFYGEKIKNRTEEGVFVNNPKRWNDIIQLFPYFQS